MTLPGRARGIVPAAAWLLLVVGCTGSIESGPSAEGDQGNPAGPGGSGTTTMGPNGPGPTGSGAPGASAPGTGGTATVKPNACATSAGQPTAGRIMRLTALELANTLGDLVSAQAAANLSIERDNLALGFSTGDGRSVSSTYLDSLQRAAESAGAELRKTVAAPKFASTCFASDTAARACADRFARDFGKRAFRRPIEDREATGLLAVYDAGRETATSTDATERMKAGIDWMVRAVLQAPSFVYRVELGDPAAANGAVTRLTPYELATVLSYTVTASPPDAELLAAADAGRLANADGMAAQARRLMTARPEGWKAQMRRFVTEWLGIDFEDADWNKSPTAYPLFSSAVKDAFQQELAGYVGDWAASGPASLTKLFTSPQVYVNKSSAPVYGLKSVDTTAKPVPVDGKQRVGVLMQGAFLGSHGHVDGSAPILRGIQVRRTLLCLPTPQPPADVPPVPAAKPADAPKTTRQRFEAHIQANGAACTTCHNLFNPMGYTFESFDGIGAFRASENGVQVDTSGAIVGTSRSDKPVANAIELAQALAASPDVHDCLATQVFRYSAGRIETDYDQCSLSRAVQSFTAKDRDVAEMLVALLTSDSYALRLVTRQ